MEAAPMATTRICAWGLFPYGIPWIECEGDAVHLKDPWLEEKAFQRISRSTHWGQFGAGASAAEKKISQRKARSDTFISSTHGWHVESARRTPHRTARTYILLLCQWLKADPVAGSCCFAVRSQTFCTGQCGLESSAHWVSLYRPQERNLMEILYNEADLFTHSIPFSDR